MGCIASGCDRISLELVLGHDGSDQAWALWTNGTCLVLDYSNPGESRIRTSEFLLNKLEFPEVLPSDPVSCSGGSSMQEIRWHSFQIHSLVTDLEMGSRDHGFTVRKLSLQFILPTALEFMGSSGVYLGFLQLKAV